MNIENLKQARETAHFTQMQAAKSLGISDGTYKNYEQGKREPNNTLLLKIADLYGVTTDYLLGREAKEPEPNLFENLELTKEQEEDANQKYKMLTPQDKAIVASIIKAFVEAHGQKQPEIQTKKERHAETLGELKESATEEEAKKGA